MQARHAAGNWLGRARARRRAWGRSLREYMRDYNHWATMGVLNELLPYPDNRVTLAEETDPYGQWPLPVLLTIWVRHR